MNNPRKYAGVTLLEIILVLAIAAMIMVLSIKYYQSATNSSMANTVVTQLHEITKQADHLAASSGSYTTANISNATLAPILPNNVFTTPWGGTLTVTVTNDTTLNILFSTPPPYGACIDMMNSLAANKHYQAPSGTLSSYCQPPAAPITMNGITISPTVITVSVNYVMNP